MSLLIRNIRFLVRNPDCIELDCDLLIEGNHIAAIGQNLTPPPDARVLDASGCAVIPGFINAHTHLYQNFLKGVSRGIPLVPWCNEVLFPTVGAMRDQFAAGEDCPAYLWSAAASIEMIKGGTTACINMDVTSPNLMKAWVDIGFRGILAYTLSNRWVPADIRNPDDDMRSRVLQYIETWHKPDGLTRIILGPSTIFLCDDGLMQWVRQQSEHLDLYVQIHVSETAEEVQESLAETGLTPVQRLDQFGLLGPRLSAVHCVHVNAAEIDMLASSKTMMVHCPKSNMKLADGIAPLVDFKQAGIPISLGTDGCGSNDLLDMWEEMRAALLLGRVAANDASAFTPQDVFRMATSTAALTAGLDAGTLDPGRLADLAVVELTGAHLRPFHADNVINMLVFCGRASDVRDTIINGEVVMRDRRITRLDEQAILQQAETCEAPLYQRRAHYRF